MNRPMKAYVVGYPGDDEGRQEVVFAATASKARYKVYRTDLCVDAELTEIEARRAPQFDGLLHPQALCRAQLDDGWWFSCSGCGAEHVSAEGTEDDEGATAWPVVRPSGDVYCSSACCLRELRRRRDERIALWEAIERATKRWPGAGIKHVSRNAAGEWLFTVECPDIKHPVLVLEQRDPPSSGPC